MIEKIVSGGQTGADRGGLDAAIELGIPHGGWCPRGRKAEDGRIPERYELRETLTSAYAERTERNVVDSCGTVIFTPGPPTGGSAATVEMARKYRRPYLLIDVETEQDYTAARMLREWVELEQIRVLNVAGSRASKAPGLDEWVRKILIDALRWDAGAPPPRPEPTGTMGLGTSDTPLPEDG